MDAPTPLGTCGCCQSLDAPPQHQNPPGLPAIRYRIGVHGEFLHRMLERLGRFQLPDGPNAGNRPLRALATRSTADPAIALLDAWAATCDVLTFYQERIANESFLRTATERQSVLELARAIGYELSPGVAAAALLQFTVDPAVGAPQISQVEIGVKVQSIPGAGQLPQTFETIEAGETRAAWNALQPVQTMAQNLSGKFSVLLSTAAARLNAADFLLFTDGSSIHIALVRKATSDAAAQQTTLDLDRTLPNNPGTPFVLRQHAGFFGNSAPDWRNLPLATRQMFDSQNPNRGDWPHFELSHSTFQVDLDADYSSIVPGAWVYFSGGNHPLIAKINSAEPVSHSDFGLTAKITRLHLDRHVDLSTFPRRSGIIRFQSEELPLAEAPIPDWVTGDDIKLSARIPLPPVGRKVIVTGKRKRARAFQTITLVSADGLQHTPVAPQEGYLLLEAPRVIAPQSPHFKLFHLRADNGVEGFAFVNEEILPFQPPRDDDPFVSEASEISDASDFPGGPTRLRLKFAIAGVYQRSTVTIGANVLQATHGETQREVMGSGQGSQPNQQFTLQKNPLTYVPAATPSGGASTLKVRVNGIEWTPVPTLYGSAPGDQVYTVRQGRDGSSTAIFGDGLQGARVPSGAENVTAQYRIGIGPDGEVDAGKLSLLQIRPYGVKAVTNPLAASGAAAPESLDDARQNAPIKVLTLDRVVSIRDYEDFARAFSGVGKAKVGLVWSQGRRLITLTLGTASGKPADPASLLVTSLAGAIDNERPFRWPLALIPFRPAFFRIDLNVQLDPRYIANYVLAAIRQALTDAFSFRSRGFAQLVSVAEIYALVQPVPGVVGVDINKLYRVDDASGPAQTEPPPVLLSGPATAVGATLYGAELLLLDPHPQGIALQEVS